MGRLILSIILIAAAVGIFMIPTTDLLDQAEPIETSRNDFKDALDSAQDIKSQRDKLEDIRNTFSVEDEQSLERFLPDNIDSVRLIVEIKDIVEGKAGLFLEEISVSDKEEELAAALEAVGFSSITLSFQVRGDYFSFKDLLNDLERNLRIVDVINLDIGIDEVTGEYTFAVVIRTYWISQANNNNV